MFLTLDHQKLDVYSIAREFVLQCYRLSKNFPPDERYAMCQQLRRAALSTHLNVCEGASRRTSPDRRRFYEIARSSVVEIDAIFDIAHALEYFHKDDVPELSNLTVRVFQLLTGLINKN